MGIFICHSHNDVMAVEKEKRDGDRWRQCALLFSQYGQFQREIKGQGVESTLTICDFFRGTDCDALLGKACEKTKKQ